MKQYYITTQNIGNVESDIPDCYLAPTDIAHTLKQASYLGGLGNAELRAEQNITNTINQIREIQKRKNE